MKNKQILITGGNGFIGSSIVKELKVNNQITIIDKSERIQSNKEIKIFTGNVADNAFMLDTLKNLSKNPPDYIFHFGAPSSNIQYNQNPTQCMNETVSGFINVMNMAKNLGCKKVIFPSSSTIYHPNSKREGSKETDTPKPTNIYGIGKLTTEILANYYRDIFGIESIGFRIFAGFGDGEENKGSIASPVSLFLFDMLKGKAPIIWGDGSQKRDFVYIKDIKNILTLSAQLSSKERIFNLGSGKTTSFRELIVLLNNNLMEFGFIRKEISPKFIDKPISYIEETLADTSLFEKTFSYKTTYLEDALKTYLTYIQDNDVIKKIK
ncbi:MAG: NAD-dependent epimerase/dehydratase family protein [Candidatus Micrarchaeaceae archaeon]